MVEFATCSYGEFRPDMGTPVRISLGVPKFPVTWLNPNRLVRVLSPHWEYLNASDEVYEQRYLAQLKRVGVEGISSILQGIADEADPSQPLVLLCFEKLGAQKRKAVAAEDVSRAESMVCHRRLFAQWWERETGLVVPELGSRVPVLTPDTLVEPPLF